MPPGLLAISCRRNGDINILWHHAGQRPQTSDCHLSLFHLVVAQGRPPICRTDWRGAAGRANLSCAMLWLCRFWGLISFRPAPLAERPKGCTLKRPPVGSIPSGRSQQCWGSRPVVSICGAPHAQGDCLAAPHVKGDRDLLSGPRARRVT